jgi:hypothetical protein
MLRISELRSTDQNRFWDYIVWEPEAVQSSIEDAVSSLRDLTLGSQVWFRTNAWFRIFSVISEDATIRSPDGQQFIPELELSEDSDSVTAPSWLKDVLDTSEDVGCACSMELFIVAYTDGDKTLVRLFAVDEFPYGDRYWSFAHLA